MDEAVDGHQRHRGVGEDLVPFSERLICRDEHGSALVSGADQLEEHAGLGLILGDVGEILEDQEMESVEPVDRHVWSGHGVAAAGPRRNTAGRETEWQSASVPAYKRLTKRAEAAIAGAYLAGTNTGRVRRALAGLFGGKVGKDTVSRAWRKVKTDWESWQARDLSGEDIVRLILGVPGSRCGSTNVLPRSRCWWWSGCTATVRKFCSRSRTWVARPRRLGAMCWRIFSPVAWRAPALLIVDGGKGLEAAQITMRRVDGWQTLDQAPADKDIDLAA